MTIHKEGYKPIIISFLIIALLALLFTLLLPEFTTWHILLYGALTLVFIWVVLFFRLPARDFSIQDGTVISPADGRVVHIKEVIENEYFDKPMRQISVFMSPLNVHANWYPVSGDVVYTKYHPGKYLVAWHPKSSVLNERMTIGIKTHDKKDVLVRQVAGLLARRIICYSKVGQSAQQGRELGFIRFGSRLDVFIPITSKVLVQHGETVKGGVSTLATL